jgi:predicted alpha/beta superfamily hydrolase
MPDAATVMNGLLASEYFDFTSSSVGDTFRIFVARPAFAGPGRYPLILTTDGNIAFTLVTSIQRTLALGEIPPAFVVGVGYPTEGGFPQAVQKRNRDYTPTNGGEYARTILGSNAEPGAAKFLALLTNELFPALRERHAIDTNEPTFVGTSLGGLFGAWTLLTAPATFSRYVLGSPSLFWNNEEVWLWEAECARVHSDLRARVFLGAGELETASVTRQGAWAIAENGPAHLRDRARATIACCDQQGWPRTAEMVPELANKLSSRGYPSLRVRGQNLPDETHLSAAPALISRGLRYVFSSDSAGA